MIASRCHQPLEVSGITSINELCVCFFSVQQTARFPLCNVTTYTPYY